MREDWLCLEFTRTVGWEARDRPDDLLGSYADLVAWAVEMECVSDRESRRLLSEARAHPRKARRVLERALELRALVYRLFCCIGEGRSVDRADVEVLNAMLPSALSARSIEGRGSAFDWSWRGDGGELDLVLSKIVWSAAELLTSEELRRVKLCRAGDCGWLYIDVSKNRSRKWCDMSDCGNREKARRFRRRRRKGAAT